MDRIVHSSAIDIGGGRRGFRSKDTVAGIPGTVVTATHMNAEQEEIVGFIERTGQVPNGADLTQLLRGVRSHRANFVTAANVTGTANAVQFAFEPTFGDLADLVGVPIIHVAEANNTGAMTVKVDSLAPVARTWPDGTPLVGGDYKAGRLYVERFDGTAFRLEGSMSPAEIVDVVRKSAPISGNWLWSQSIANNVMTTLGGSAYTADGANNLGDATFSGGVFTVGPQTAGLWIFIFSGVVTSATTDLVINNIHNNSSAIGYGTSQTANSAPGIGAVTVKRLPNTDNMRFQVRQIVGSAQNCSGRLNAIRLGA